MPKKIVITGGPGSGKTALISFLKGEGHQCIPEISREITLEAQRQGVDQLFLKNPILFSEKLLEGRLQQFQDTKEHKKTLLFFDRGLPDITAYLDFNNTSYPTYFKETCLDNRYDHVFLLPPWKEIYTQDNERYETFADALEIYKYLVSAYTQYGYSIIEVPFGTLTERMNFIINQLSQ